MTPTNLIEQLQARFPRQADEIAAWADSFARVLGILKPDDLATTYRRTMDHWPNGWFPKPADFVPNAPSHSKPDLDQFPQRRMMAEKQERELRGWIDRTFERHTEEISARETPFTIEVNAKHYNSLNPFRACVKFRLTEVAHKQSWYVSGVTAPHSHDFTERDWHIIEGHAQSRCRIASRMHNWTPPTFMGDKEAVRHSAIEQQQTRDGP